MKIVKKYLETEDERRSSLKVKNIEATVKTVIKNMETIGKSTTLLLKLKIVQYRSM